MIFQVKMLAFHDPEKGHPTHRSVRVPCEAVKDPDDIPALLELIWHYGQNDVNPNDYCCSVSMGDVATVYGKNYLAKAVGWEEISDLESYEKLSQEERQLFSLLRKAS